MATFFTLENCIPPVFEVNLWFALRRSIQQIFIKSGCDLIGDLVFAYEEDEYELIEAYYTLAKRQGAGAVVEGTGKLRLHELTGQYLLTAISLQFRWRLTTFLPKFNPYHPRPSDIRRIAYSFASPSAENDALNVSDPEIEEENEEIQDQEPTQEEDQPSENSSSSSETTSSSSEEDNSRKDKIPQRNMSVRIYSLPNNKNYEEACGMLTKIAASAGVILQCENTVLSTNFRAIESTETYAAKLASVQRPAERSAVVNEYVSRSLKDLAPLYQAYWLLNKSTFETCLKWFNSPKAKAMVDLAKVSAQQNDCSVENLNKYIEAATAFRLDCDQVLGHQHNAFQILEHEAEKIFTVPSSQAPTINMILTSIIRKRNESLGNTGVSLNTGTGPSHYKQFLSLFEVGQHLGAIDVMARRSNGIGITKDGTEFKRMERPTPGTNQKHGALLLTTAILYHRQLINDPLYIPICNDNDQRTVEAIEIATAELEQIEQGTLVLTPGGQPGSNYSNNWPISISYLTSISGATSQVLKQGMAQN